MRLLVSTIALLVSTGVSASSYARTRVPLEIHIMSQCPDAQDCFDMLIYPAMKQIEHLVDFRMEFIGTTTDSGVACKHGPTECLGNMLHLCAAHISTPPSPPPPSSYFDFSKCLLDEYPSVGDSKTVRRCAETSGMDFDAINECANDITRDEGGLRLLQKSVDRSGGLGVRKSCTVRLKEKTWCVRDGGEWRECKRGSKVEDLVRDVKKSYKEGQGKEHLLVEPELKRIK